MNRQGLAYIDLGTKSVEIVGADGAFESTWSGVTRTTAEQPISADGWHFPLCTVWTTHPDGAVRQVVR